MFRSILFSALVGKVGSTAAVFVLRAGVNPGQVERAGQRRSRGLRRRVFRHPPLFPTAPPGFRAGLCPPPDFLRHSAPRSCVVCRKRRSFWHGVCYYHQSPRPIAYRPITHLPPANRLLARPPSNATPSCPQTTKVGSPFDPPLFCGDGCCAQTTRLALCNLVQGGFHKECEFACRG